MEANQTQARQVRHQIAETEVGNTDLFKNLPTLGGIGSITVERGVATIEITLPIPSAYIRMQITQEMEAAMTDVDGVTDVRCRWEPSVRGSDERIDLIPDVKNVIAISSGKGGVGKSTISVNLAVALASVGATVGLLDADVYGPNAPAMLGLSNRTPATTLDDAINPREIHGVRVMSMDFLAGEDDPVIWRGPIVDEFIKQLFGDVEWGSLDYLIVDLPPGTGDAQLTLAQHLPVAGAVIVTTPQPVAIDDARRGLEGFARYGVPILGIAENMAGFSCPDCSSIHDIFGSNGATGLAEEFDVPVLGRIPLETSVGKIESNKSKEPPGVTVPLVGRIQLPRTREEREQQSALRPIAIRETNTQAGRALRELATRTAARVADSHHSLE